MLAPWRWPAAQVHALALLALLIWTALECFGPLRSEAIAASTYDKMQQHRLWASAPDPRLLIVDIDERSLADMAPEFGRWPWPRDTLATLLDHAQTQGASAVVFDILFSDPDRVHAGGDRALEAAVRSGTAGFFPVARLPSALDARSDLRAHQVPGLATAGTSSTPAPRVALILPFMQAMIDSAHLGTHTVQLDADGKIRRFAASEALAGGWSLHSIPSVVARHLGVVADMGTNERLIVWRRHADTYARIPFAVAWQCAEGRQRDECPDLAGRILIVGATASSLHDVKTTPLANQHMGVDILATLIDNALHGRRFDELSATLRWLLSAFALLLAWAVVRRGSTDATSRALWGLPLVLLAIGYASLHTETMYVDLTLPATAALAFLSAVKLHDTLRLRLCGLRPDSIAGPRAIVFGGPAAQAERLERAVLDAAAGSRLRVTGSKAAGGAHGTAHAVWVLWALPNAVAAERLETTLRQSVPLAWCRSFEVGSSPHRDLFLAVAEALPTTHPQAREALQEPSDVRL